MNSKNNIFWAIAGRMTGMISLIVINSIVAKNLNLSDFAFFSLCMSIIPSFFTFLTFGQDISSSKFLTESKNKSEHQNNVIKTLSIMLFIYFTFFFIFYDSIINFFYSNTFFTYSIFLLILFSAFLRIISDYSRANNEFKYFILFNSIRSSGGIIVWFLFLVSTFLLLFFEQFSIENIFYSLSFSCLSTLILYLFFKRKSLITLISNLRNIFTINNKFKFFFKSSFLISLSSILVMLKSDYDFWIVSFFGNENELAFYAPIIKTAILIMVPLSIFESMIPKNISYYYLKENKDQLERYIRSINTFMFYSSLIVLIILFFFSEDFLMLIFGEKYIHLSYYLKIVILSFIPKIILGPCGMILLLTKFEKLNLYVNLFYLLLSTILGIMLTIYIGYIGMVITYIIGIIMINITFYFFVRVKLKINTLPYFNFLNADFHSLMR